MGTKELTEKRGRRYGPALYHFACTTEMHEAWIARRMRAVCDHQPDQERALQHVVYMIVDKLTRAAEDPEYEDNWEDIMGYASLWLDIVRG